QEVLRLFVTTAFLAWLYVGVPTPWTNSDPTSSSSFSSRHVLAVSETSTSFFMDAAQGLLSIFLKLITFFAVFLIVWVLTLLQDMPKVTKERVRAAEEHLRACE